MFAGRQSLRSLAMVQEGGRRYVHQVDPRIAQKRLDVCHNRHSEPFCRGSGGRPMSSGYPGKSHSGHLDELLHGKQPEPAAADHADSQLIGFHLGNIEKR